MTKPVIVLGGGGHAKVLIDILCRLDCRVLGIIDPNQAVGSLAHGFKVLGGDDAVFDYSSEEVELVNAIGSLPNDKGLRAKLFKAFSTKGYRFKTLVDPTAIVAPDVELSAGVQVMAGVIIQAGTRIAFNSIVNSGAIVDHDCRIGSHVHIAPGAVLSGAVVVGEAAHIGTGAMIIQGISIGDSSIIGAGSVITRSIACDQIVYPARPLIRSISRDKV